MVNSGIDDTEMKPPAAGGPNPEPELWLPDQNYTVSSTLDGPYAMRPTYQYLNFSDVAIVFSVISAYATAQQIAFDLIDYVHECENGNDDWAYVDLLDMRQQLNSQAMFLGDAALRTLLQKKKCN